MVHAQNKSREEIVYMKSKLLSGLLLVAVGFSFTQVIYESHLKTKRTAHSILPRATKHNIKTLLWKGLILHAYPFHFIRMQGLYAQVICPTNATY